MKLDVEFDKKDLAELRAMLPTFRREIDSMMDTLVTRDAPQEVKALAPARSGKVRGSIRGELEGKLGGAIVSDWFVTRLQNYGYAAHTAKLPNGPFVDIPGKPKNTEGYFVEPGIEKALDRLDMQFERLVDNL